MTHPATGIADYYRKRNLLPSDTIDCLEYVLKSFFNEWSKVAIYCVIALLFGKLAVFLLCYITFVTIRLFAGGIHCKTYWGCFVLSFLFLGGCVIGSAFFSNNLSALYIITLISCIIPLLFSPVTPSFRVIKEKRHQLFLKVFATVVGMGWICIAYFLTTNYNVSAAILLTVSTANYQLPIPIVANIFSKYHRKDRR